MTLDEMAERLNEEIAAGRDSDSARDLAQARLLILREVDRRRTAAGAVESATMTTERTKGEGPVAEVHRRLDALEQRMADELAKLEERIADARPADDPEMRERVGQALGVEDRAHAPVGTYVSQPFGNFWHVELVQVSGDRKHAIEAAWGFVDSLRAPLRAECERLRERLKCTRRSCCPERDAIRDRAEEAEAECERLREKAEQSRKDRDDASSLRERAEQAEAALADCQRERDQWPESEGDPESAEEVTP